MKAPDELRPCCPVCGLTLRAGELEQHLMLEVDKLNKVARSVAGLGLGELE